MRLFTFATGVLAYFTKLEVGEPEANILGYSIRQASYGENVVGQLVAPILLAAPDPFGCYPLSDDGRYHGAVVLVQSGGACHPVQPTANAARVNASAVVVYDHRPDRLYVPPLRGASPVGFPPTFSMTHKDGELLAATVAASDNTTVRINGTEGIASSEWKTLVEIAQGLSSLGVDIGRAMAGGRPWTDLLTGSPLDPCLDRLQGTACRDGHIVGLESTWPLGVIISLSALLANFPQLNYIELKRNFFVGPVSQEDFSRFQYVDLAQNQLSGNLFDLSACSQLLYLDLSFNKLSGLLPSFSSLTRLERVYLEYNAFSGALPLLHNITNAQDIAVSFNMLSGELPDLTNLTQLRVLVLDHNSFSGTIPDLRALTQIRTLRLDHNILSGNIPPLVSFAHVKYLRMDNNRLSGPIPSLTNLISVNWLDLSQNRLTGAVPSMQNLLRLTHLKLQRNFLCGDLEGLPFTNAVEIVLFGNRLTGAIPDLSLLTNLEILYLHDNAFSKSIPSLSALSRVMDLKLGNNQLTGSIPDLQALSRLKELELRGNKLTGRIPPLQSLALIKNLDIGYNMLTGPIPVVSHLADLEVLDVARNRLTGAVPTMAELPKLTRLTLTRNSFSGPLSFLGGLGETVNNLELGHNQFSGRVPELLNLSGLGSITLTNNLLTGSLPPLPPSLKVLFAENNKLYSHADTIKMEFPNLKMIFLSNNSIVSAVLQTFKISEPGYADLSGNSFICLYPDAVVGGRVAFPNLPGCQLEVLVFVSFWSTVCGLLLGFMLFMRFRPRKHAKDELYSIEIPTRTLSISPLFTVAGPPPATDLSPEAAEQKQLVASNTEEEKSSTKAGTLSKYKALVRLAVLLGTYVFACVDVFGDVIVNLSMIDQIRNRADVCPLINHSSLFIHFLPVSDNIFTEAFFTNRSFTFDEYYAARLEKATFRFREGRADRITVLSPKQLQWQLTQFSLMCLTLADQGCSFDDAAKSCFRSQVPNEWFADLCTVFLAVYLAKELAKLWCVLHCLFASQARPALVYNSTNSIFLPLLLLKRPSGARRLFIERDVSVLSDKSTTLGTLMESKQHPAQESLWVQILADGVLEAYPQLALNIYFLTTLSLEGFSPFQLLLVNFNGMHALLKIAKALKAGVSFVKGKNVSSVVVGEGADTDAALDTTTVTDQ